jgi:hypothetical protein
VNELNIESFEIKRLERRESDSLDTYLFWHLIHCLPKTRRHVFLEVATIIALFGALALA